MKRAAGRREAERGVDPEVDLASRLAGWTRRLHLLYLGVLPSLATFVALRTYGYGARFLLFLAGVAAVGVYLAFTYMYTVLPSSLLGNLVVLLDGPLFALAAHGLGYGMPLGFAIEGYLIDGGAVWLAILWLSLSSPAPTRGQRMASIALAVGVLGVTSSLFLPYARQYLWGAGFGPVGWLGLGLLEATVVRVRLLNSASLARGTDDASILYIALLTMVWVGAMSVGLVLHDLR